jgi:hypothetical protein
VGQSCISALRGPASYKTGGSVLHFSLEGPSDTLRDICRVLQNQGTQRAFSAVLLVPYGPYGCDCLWDVAWFRGMCYVSHMGWCGRMREVLWAGVCAGRLLGNLCFLFFFFFFNIPKKLLGCTSPAILGHLRVILVNLGAISE